MPVLTKRIKEGQKLFNNTEKYSLSEALDKLFQFPRVKFDETVEVHLQLNIDLESTEQSLRGTILLPNGTGKKLRIAVFCKGEQEQKAKDAGADFVGAQELIDKIAGGFLDFDVAIAAPDMMRDLSKLGKILGPRGLMPTPKSGTVTIDVEKAIKDVKAGKIEFKSDKQGGIHTGVGKISFAKEKLLENIQCFIEAVNQAKPAAVKGNLIKNFSIATTMGPGVRIAL